MPKRSSQHGSTVTQLYTQWFDRAVAFVAYRLLTGDCATAEDIVQTVFMHLWQQRTVVESLHPARQQAYLYRSLTNAAISLKRWQRFGVRCPISLALLPDDLERAAVVDDRDLTDAVIAQEAWNKALCRLSPDQRALVALVGRGYSYAAIVAVLRQRGATTVTSTATCVRTVRYFRAALREEAAA